MIRRAALLAAAVALAPLSHADEPPSGTAATAVNIQFLGGFKMLEDDWKPAEDQREFGLQVDVLPENWPVNLAVGFLYGNSAAEDVEIPAGGTVTSESNTAELQMGLKKYIFRDGPWRPFLGAGVALLRGEIETRGPVSATADSGMGLGFWASGGTLYVMGDWFVVGGQVQYTQGQVEVFGQDLDAGGLHVDGLVGVTF